MVSAGDALAEIERLLDRIDPRRSAVPAASRLEWVRRARRVLSRVEALTGLLVGEADRAQASERAVGTPLASWIGMGENLSRREAAGAVHRARELVEHPQVGAAALAGELGSGQVRTINKLLSSLAPQLTDEQRRDAEGLLVGLAKRLDSDQLARSAPQVLAQVAPASADELLETRLQREVEAAQRQRSLRFFREAGSVRFEGSLPRIEGQLLISLIGAHAEAQRRSAIEERDPAAEQLTPEQRRADALISLLRAATAAVPSPGVGAARVIVRLSYAHLHDLAAGAGLIGPDEPISAGELRRLCCGAELLPVVLGGRSEVLDVGRSSRLVTPAIRTALSQRDLGCAFPGCDLEASLCEAHHISPWWAGGRTSLGNLVLLCHSHHGFVEPAKYGVRDQWEVRLASDGLPEFVPPTRVDAERKPLRNRRVAAMVEQASKARAPAA